MAARWEIRFHPDFEPEFGELSDVVQDELLAKVGLLEIFGPFLGRPNADNLHGSRYANMKEIRFDADGGVWRVAYAFDPTRQGILLVAADKGGVSQPRFYRRLIRQADNRYGEHLGRLRRNRG